MRSDSIQLSWVGPERRGARASPDGIGHDRAGIAPIRARGSQTLVLPQMQIVRLHSRSGIRGIRPPDSAEFPTSSQSIRCGRPFDPPVRRARASDQRSLDSHAIQPGRVRAIRGRPNPPPSDPASPIRLVPVSRQRNFGPANNRFGAIAPSIHRFCAFAPSISPCGDSHSRFRATRISFQQPIELDTWVGQAEMAFSGSVLDGVRLGI